MTTQTNSATSAQPGNTYLNGIWWNTEWVNSSNPANPVTITWASNTGFTGVTAHALNAAELAAVQQIFSDISAVCNISFVQGAANTADILLNADTFTAMNAEYQNSLNSAILGIADPPGTYLNGTDEQSWVFANRTNYSANGLNKGGYDYITWLHEIGHALGLAHPHDNGGGSTIFPGVTGSSSLGTDSLNQGVYTTMSYNDGWAPFKPYLPQQYGWQATMMAFDVAALQLKYGANMNYNTVDNYYVLSDTAGIGSFASCIWDAGGSDWIYYGGASGAVIDLRAATLGTGVGAGGFISYVGGNPYRLFTIANNVVIENAAGGQGADTIVGNTASNTIYTYGGADTVYSLDGNDVIVTDSGNDIALGGANNDYLYGGADVDYLYGDDADDALYGGTGNDIMYGGAGFDQLSGGGGIDIVYGGTGTDYFNMTDGAANGGYDAIADFALGTDYIQFQSSLQTGLYFYISGGTAICYVALAAGGAYQFGVVGISAAQLQSSVFLY